MFHTCEDEVSYDLHNYVDGALQIIVNYVSLTSRYTQLAQDLHCVALIPDIVLTCVRR